MRNYLALVLFTCMQLGFWAGTRHDVPDMSIVPDVPGKSAIHAMTFGDDEFYFRVLGLMIQNAGDTFGRFTALRYYDFNKLYLWFNLLDELDSKSNMIPALATYYFSQTQNTADVRYVVDYLYTHATRDVADKWWWLVQAIYLSMHKLGDQDLALKVAKPLVNKDVPAWAQQMTAVVYEKRGEMDDALRIMETIQKHAKHISPDDLKFMTYFVKERLHRLDQLEKDQAKTPLPGVPAAEEPPVGKDSSQAPAGYKE